MRTGLPCQFVQKLAFLLFVLLCFNVSASAEATSGKMTGGVKYSIPSWFKDTFLDIKEEVGELRNTNRHLLLFMDLEECPYCARMLDENFRQGKNMEFIKKNFNVIDIDIRGSRDVTWLDGNIYSERVLSRKIKAWGTPGLVFIDAQGKIVLQLTGYRTPATLRLALEYVHTKAYRTQTLAAYIEKRQKTAVYRTFRDHPSFEEVSDFAGYKKPLAVIFEDRNCADCDGFHDKVLSHPDVRAEMKLFRVVRLDAYSDLPVTDITGTRTTPRKWAASLQLTHRPGIVLFNEGKEIARVEGRFFHFHFKEMLRYVSGDHYKQHERFGFYLQERQSYLLEQGVDIDFAE